MSFMLHLFTAMAGTYYRVTTQHARETSFAIQGSSLLVALTAVYFLQWNLLLLVTARYSQRVPVML